MMESERRGGIIMPYISFKTNHKLTLRQENTIKSKSGELISLISW